MTIKEDANKLMAEYPVLKRALPLKIGIYEDIEKLVENPKKVVRLLIYRYAYQKQIVEGADRYNLDGTVSSKVTLEETERSKEFIENFKTCGANQNLKTQRRREHEACIKAKAERQAKESAKEESKQVAIESSKAKAISSGRPIITLKKKRKIVLQEAVK